MPGEREGMTCAEFQRLLPSIIDSGDATEEQHLENCESCAALVADLRYIAEQAKLLLPLRDPSPHVWQRIERSLTQEGLAAPARTARPGRSRGSLKRAQWSGFGWAAAVAAVVLLGIAAFQLNKSQNPAPVQQAAVSTTMAAQSGEPMADDGELMEVLSDREPAVQQAYQNSLRDVNDYIREAKSALDENPSSMEARDHLREAYAQKAMLYEIAYSMSGL